MNSSGSGGPALPISRNASGKEKTVAVAIKRNPVINDFAILRSGRKRKISPTQYARFPYGRAPLRPYHPRRGAVWKQGDRRLIEFPISTIPILRFPFHGTFALKEGLGCFKLGLGLLKRSRGTLNYVFHALEFSDPLPESPLPFTVANHIPWGKKEKFYQEIFSRITRYYEILPTRDLLRSEKFNL